MGRRLSWLDRLHPIARSVAGSTRSHYGRKDLQELFELQPRAAQTLMASLPVVAVGTAHLVEREVLQSLLERLKNSTDPAALYAGLRTKPAKTVRRRRLRALSLSDAAASLDTPPGNVTLRQGEVLVHFTTLDELALGMVYLARQLQENLDGFALRYEPPAEPEDV